MPQKYDDWVCGQFRDVEKEKREIEEGLLSQKLKSSKDYELDYHEEMVTLIAKRSPLGDLLEQVREKQTSAIENYLKLRIRPKPPYLPNPLWKFILSKLVYLQYFEA